MSYPDTYVEFDAENYIMNYGVSGAVESAMGDVMYALYVAFAEHVGQEPKEHEDFFSDWYDNGDVVDFRHQVFDYLKSLGVDLEDAK